MLKSIWRTVFGGIMLGILTSFVFFSCVNVLNFKKVENNLTVVENSKYNTYNNNNFILFERHILTGENSELCYIDDECEKKPDSKYVKDSASSGGALRIIKGRVYGFTAGHFCIDMIEDEHGNILPAEKAWDAVIVAKFMGEVYATKLEKLDVDKDLCLLSFKSHPLHNRHIDNINLSKEVLEVGDPVYTISAPLSIHSDNLRIHFDGKYAGVEDVLGSMFTIPAIFGSSGSLVLNEKGELVSVLSISVIPFPEISAGPSVLEIREFLRQYEASSGIKLH